MFFGILSLLSIVCTGLYEPAIKLSTNSQNVGIQDFGILESANLDFVLFMDLCLVLRPSSYSHIYTKIMALQTMYQNIIYISSHHTISYQGGGDYRGIYDTGLKRGFYGVCRPFIECPLQDR
jgi:hypothetical protein